MKRSAATPTQREQALRLVERGWSAAEVARELDVPAGTVRCWAHRAAKAAPVETSPLDSPRLAEQIEQLARASFAAAERALAEFDRQLEAGKPTNAKSAAIAQGVLIDQVEKLRRIAAEMGEREVRLAEAQARQLAAVIRAILTDLGHDLEDENVRNVVRLRLLEGGKRA